MIKLNFSVNTLLRFRMSQCLKIVARPALVLEINFRILEDS